MILLEIVETDKNLRITSVGHSIGTDEPCARVSTMLDLIKLFLRQFIVEEERKNGYTYINVIKSPLSEQYLVDIVRYMLELTNLYPAHIKLKGAK